MTAAAPSNRCAAKPSLGVDRRIVSVNGVVISRADIAREIQNHPAAKATGAWMAAARALVVRELLLQEARRIGIAATPLQDEDGRRETDDEAAIRELIARDVATPEAGTAECRRVFDQNRQRFRSPDLYEVRHILIAADPRDAPARAQAMECAAAMIAHLQQDATAFAQLAAAESACPSAKTGGNLGQIGPGQTVPEFEQALARLPVGQISPIPVETRYGMHIVRVDRRIDGVALPFEALQSRIAAWLNEKVRRQAIRQYIAILAGRAEIVGVDLPASASPLVQ